MKSNHGNSSCFWLYGSYCKFIFSSDNGVLLCYSIAPFLLQTSTGLGSDTARLKHQKASSAEIATTINVYQQVN